jgi:hypothetical protein
MCNYNCYLIQSYFYREKHSGERAADLQTKAILNSKSIVKSKKNAIQRCLYAYLRRSLWLEK